MGKATPRSKTVAKKKAAAPAAPAPPANDRGPASVPPPSARTGLVLPVWLKPRVEGLFQKCEDVDWDEQGPDQLAAALLEGIKEVAAEELGDYAARIGAVRLEPLKPTLTKALGKEFDLREGLEGLGKSANKGWLAKVVSRALGLRFDEPRPIQVPVLARPLFERAVGDALERVRGSASDPRTVVRFLVEALDATAREAGLADVAERIAAARAAMVPFEQSVRRAIVGLHLSGAPTSTWARLGFADIASRGRHDGEWISVPRAIWAGRREDATGLLDRLGQPLGLVWNSADTRGSDTWTERLGQAGVVRQYKPDQVFARGDAVSHARFGIGVVTMVEQGRVEVTFPDGVRKLAHAG